MGCRGADDLLYLYFQQVSYPFLNVPFPGRLTIYLGATAIATGSFRLLNRIHSDVPLMPSMYGVPKTKDI